MKLRSFAITLGCLMCIAASAVVSPDAPAAPPDRVSTADQARQAQVRSQFGLPASDEAIALADRSASATTTELGIPLTPAESAEIARRDAVAKRAGSLSGKLAAAEPQSFGGAWIDQRAGGVIRVAVVSGAGANRIRSIAKSDFASDDVQFSTVRFSAGRLQTVQDELSVAMVKKAGVGAYASQVSVDVVRNHVLLRVAAGTPAALIASVQKRYPQVVVEASDSTWQSQSRDRSSGPLYGGAWISSASNCTDGYSNAFVGDRRVTLTAGHCPAGPWYQGLGRDGYLVGGTIANGFVLGGSSYCDCKAVGRISSSKVTSSVLTNDTTTYYYSRTASSGDYVVGNRLCLSGAEYAGQHNGAIACGQIDAGSTSITYSDGRYTLRDAVITDIVGTYAGDSGGPYGSGRTFMGLHAAGRLSFGIVVQTALSKSSRISGIGVGLRY